MPEISEEQFKEYMALKRKEKIRQQEIDKLIKQGPSVVKKWRKDLNTYRGHAAVFANVLQKEYERRGKPKVFVLDRWRVVMEYLPPHLINKRKRSPTLNVTFRRYMLQYGWKFRIDNGLFEVTKIL